MTTKKKWKVGILGLGHWYSAYGLARSLPEYPRAELVAVAAADSPHLDQFAQTFGVPSYHDPAALLERRDIDIVQISARVSQVPGLTLRAARAGKHIILGKPMAMTLAQADEMVGVVREAGVTCVPFQAIMRLRLLDLKDRIARGDIGEIAVMHQTSMCPEGL
jgi:predicted dehydrogenase